MVLLLPIAVASAALFSPAQLPPIDQCSRDLSFVQFRTELRRAVARRDRGKLEAALADDILVDLGGNQGRRAFVRAWRLDGSKVSPVWKELSQLLRLGCSGAYPDKPIMPSLATAFSAEDDLFDKLVAIVPGAKLRAAPQSDARIVASLNYHVVRAPGGPQQQTWLRATLADGRSGYIRRDQLRSPLDYRAGFEKRGGRWQMTSFIAGD